MDYYVSKLQAVTDYVNLSHALSEVEGHLLDVEGYALMTLASEGHGTGEILEIGSYLGRSACWLATGSKRAHREKVTAVDHFNGSPEQQAGGECESKVIVEEGTTFRRFQENVRRASVEDYVTPIVAPSEEAVRSWNKPIRLLFIDGDHTYEASRQDYELWSPFIAPGGYICFHDIGHAPGVTRFFKELMQSTDLYTHVVRKSRRTAEN